MFVKKYDPLLEARYEEVNTLFKKHFNINLPEECRSLKDIISLTNQLHFKQPTWYASFLASIMDIWQSYEEELNPEETNL